MSARQGHLHAGMGLNEGPDQKSSNFFRFGQKNAIRCQFSGSFWHVPGENRQNLKKGQNRRTWGSLAALKLLT